MISNRPLYRIRRGLGRIWYVSVFTAIGGMSVVPGTTGTRDEAIRALRVIRRAEGAARRQT
mgnify:CR=1 FL=1